MLAGAGSGLCDIFNAQGCQAIAFLSSAARCRRQGLGLRPSLGLEERHPRLGRHLDLRCEKRHAEKTFVEAIDPTLLDAVGGMGGSPQGKVARAFMPRRLVGVSVEVEQGVRPSAATAAQGAHGIVRFPGRPRGLLG